MDVKPNRMISLGYGKYWRSDAILGLMPIETDRGPGRRTEVYTSLLDQPLVASRSHRAILQDMAVASDEILRVQELREALTELADSLDDIPDVVQRLLASESAFDASQWAHRLRAAVATEGLELSSEQNDLFD